MKTKSLSALAIASLLGCNTNGAGTDNSGTVAATSSALHLGEGQGGDDQGEDQDGRRDERHVLLISVDGMHQSDLDGYVASHPTSTLAKLIHSGSEYTNAAAANPSDSDPGGTALMTGGTPRSTGVFYDVEYSHKVDEAGAACTPGQPATGGDVIYDSPDDALAAVPDFIDPANGTFPSFDENGSIFANGVDTNPAAIMNLKFDPETSLNSGTFPVDPKTCKPITPWDYLGVNTIFQVIHKAGLRTAWSDKHEVYASFNGPGSNGQSIDDLFSPEIDSQAVMPNGVPYPQDDDWAHIDAAAKQYDGYKVQAILNEIDGLDHSGKTRVGTPAIFGMNFQTVSVAEKIRSTPTTLIGPDANGNYTTSAPEAGGYQWVNGQLVPGPVLSSALDYVDAQLGRMVSTIHKKDDLADSTTIIVTAKHGQSPQDPNELITVQDGPIISAINAAWAQMHPSNTSLIVAGTDDDLWQSYLSDNSQAACDFVKSYLWDHTAQGFDVNKNPVPVEHSGLAQIWAGAAAANFFGVSVDNGHYPDVFGKVQVGIVYAKPTKLAEHGGMNTGDLHVLMVVSGPGIPVQVESTSVETTQVAPTILALLGLNPHALTAVKIEGTQVLPGLGGPHARR